MVKMSLDRFREKLHEMLEDIRLLDPYSQEYVDSLVDRIQSELVIQ